MKKVFSVIGILTGIGLIIFGWFVLTGGFNGGFSFDLDLPTVLPTAMYRGDFTSVTARATGIVAINVGDIYELLEICIGVLMLFFGITSVCGFGFAMQSANSGKKDQIYTDLTENEDSKLEEVENDMNIE